MCGGRGEPFAFGGTGTSLVLATYSRNGDLLSREDGESVTVFDDGQNVEVIEIGLLQHTHQWLCRELFQPRLMPAFFFDGEQAQKLITSTGEGGVQRAVGVLFGTDTLREVEDDTKNDAATLRRNIGGGGRSDHKREAVEEKRRRRDGLDEQVRSDGERLAELQRARDENRNLVERLSVELAEVARLGEQRDLAAATEQSAGERLVRARDKVAAVARNVGLARAVA